MRWLFLPLLAAACVPKGPHPLHNMTPGPTTTGSLVIESSAVLLSEPGSSLDLKTTLGVKNTGEGTIRVDLTRARVSVDGQPFITCKQGAGTEASDLIKRLKKGESGEVKVTCRDIAKPIQKVEFKFHASGTGAAGEISVAFLGLGERP